MRLLDLMSSWNSSMEVRAAMVALGCEVLPVQNDREAVNLDFESSVCECRMYSLYTRRAGLCTAAFIPAPTTSGVRVPR